MTTFNDMQTVKRRLFAMRNGVIADALRRAGSPFRIIFGVNLPQLVEIAEGTPHTCELAQALWDNRTTRESLLLAPMLYPRRLMTADIAARWMRRTMAPEVADILCHRLLRHLPFAEGLVDGAMVEDDDLTRYCGLRLMFNLVSALPEKALGVAVAEQSRGCRLTAPVAAMLAEEARFLLGE